MCLDMTIVDCDIDTRIDIDPIDIGTTVRPMGDGIISFHIIVNVDIMNGYIRTIVQMHRPKR